MCPIQVWKLYTTKLNKNIDSLWQKPRQGKVFYDDKEWFEGRVVGKDPLIRFMKFLSQDLKLNTEYTNHSIRSTVITTLDNAGFEARHIMQLSSHKNEATIKEYSVKCPENKRREMSDSLSDAILPKKKKIEPTCTVSLNPDQDVKDVILNLPSFDIVPVDDYDTIDDKILSELVYQAEKDYQDSKTLNQNNNNNCDKTENETAQVAANSLALPVQPQVPEFIQQSNTQNTKITNNKFPILPQMYFPNSNVTINYNFGK